MLCEVKSATIIRNALLSAHARESNVSNFMHDEGKINFPYILFCELYDTHPVTLCRILLHEYPANNGNLHILWGVACGDVAVPKIIWRAFREP